MRLFLGLLISVASQLGAAEAVGANTNDYFDRFDAHLEQVLPPNASSDDIRRQARIWMDQAAREARADRDLYDVQARRPWVAAEASAYKARVEAQADQIIEALRQPGKAPILDMIGRTYAIISTFEGNRSARYAAGTILTTLTAATVTVTMPVVVIAWAQITGFKDWDYIFKAMSTVGIATGATAAVGLVGLHATRLGRRLINAAGVTPSSALNAEFLETHFWSRLRANIEADPTLKSYLPTARRANFPSFFLSRLNDLHGNVVRDCESWLRGPFT